MKNKYIPLADRMRPADIKDFVGQEHLVGEGKILNQLIVNKALQSLIFWGPPGTGKTTLASIIAASCHSFFVPLSAVTSGIKDVREIIRQAVQNLQASGRNTILFIDEIHRFNKAQQDALLPHVEKGDIIFFGATTENPSFEVISPLLSRTKVLLLRPLTKNQVINIMKRALHDKLHGLGNYQINIDFSDISLIAQYSQGDARVALNALDIAFKITPSDKCNQINITRSIVEEAVQNKMLMYDKAGEEHYNLISALHKSLRESDTDASLYWLCRMLEAGEDPLYIARRLVRFASEDIGNADPRALQIALDAKDAFHFIGLPEGNLALAQVVIYRATSPKSNAVYTAFTKVKDAIRSKGTLPVPLHLRNAPTDLMKSFGYGDGYKYAHDYPDAVTDQQCLPDELVNDKFYFPKDQGYEKIIKERMAFIQSRKKSANKSRNA